jgi:hypothetical protein
MKKNEGYILGLTTLIIALLFSNLYLSFIVLKNKFKNSKKENFKKREKENLLKTIELYEMKKVSNLGINYITGEEKLWMIKNGISQGNYRILKIVNGYETIYKVGDDIIPSEKMYLNNSLTSKYKVYLTKNIILKEIEVEVLVEIQLTYNIGNLNFSYPNNESFENIKVELK